MKETLKKIIQNTEYQSENKSRYPTIAFDHGKEQGKLELAKEILSMSDLDLDKKIFLDTFEEYSYHPYNESGGQEDEKVIDLDYIPEIINKIKENSIKEDIDSVNIFDKEELLDNIYSTSFESIDEFGDKTELIVEMEDVENIINNLEFKLSKNQKAGFVWNLSINMYNNTMLIALEITHGKEACKEISNLQYKYQDEIGSGEIKTLNDFKEIFNEDLSSIDQEMLSM